MKKLLLLFIIPFLSFGQETTLLIEEDFNGFPNNDIEITFEQGSWPGDFWELEDYPYQWRIQNSENLWGSTDNYTSADGTAFFIGGNNNNGASSAFNPSPITMFTVPVINTLLYDSVLIHFDGFCYVSNMSVNTDIDSYAKIEVSQNEEVWYEVFLQADNNGEPITYPEDFYSVNISSFDNNQVYVRFVFEGEGFWAIDNLQIIGYSPLLGCTDDIACNYNSDATEDDGSCQYSPTPITFTTFSLLDCCPNPSVIGITDLTAFGGTPPYNYTWQYQNGIIIADGPNETFIEVVAAGNYIITVTDALGCSQQSTISIDPNCFNEVTFYTSDADCNENNGYIEIDISFGEPEYNTVLGSADGQIISGQSSGGWVEFENLAPGQYFFSTQDANGCLMAGDEMFFEIFEINCDESCDTVYIEVPVIEYIDCDTGLPCTSGMAEIIEKSKTNGKLYNLLGQEIFRREGIYIEGGEIKYRF